MAEERSFTRAAERLHVAQPALSVQVRNLEEELAGAGFGLVVAASYLGALYLPLVAGAYAAAGIETVIANVVWLVSGRRGPRPTAEPTPAWRDEYRRERPAPR